MKRVQVLLDEPSARILKSVAGPFQGNKSLAIREVLKAHRTVESLLGRIERFHRADLRKQKQRSEDGFRHGSFTTWEEV